MLWMTLGWAQAADPVVAEEDIVYVWADRFRRWRDTRWRVNTDFILPTGLTLMSVDTLDVHVVAMQLEAVLHCNPEQEGRRMEVRCELEDVSLRVATARRNRKPRDLEVVKRVLEEIDASLTGAVLQLQVNAKGAVQNVDLEGLREDNRRHRARAGMLRHLVGRLAAPYHLQLPREVRSGEWLEEDSMLMRMPSKRASVGNSELVSVLTPYQGHLLVQQKGRGLVGLKPVPGTGPLGYGNELEQEFANDLFFKMSMDGVSIFDPTTGVLKERVWSVTGKPSGGLLLQQGIVYSGNLKLLAADETVTLGPTQQVGFPRMRPANLPAWTPLTSL